MPTIADIASRIAAYDVTQSTTHLITATCHADRLTDMLVVVAKRDADIDPADWALVMDRFPIRTSEYTFDFHMIDDLDFYVLTEVGEYE